MPAYAGVSRAKALTLLGEAFTAEQAQAWGLVWQVVTDDTLEQAAAQAAARLTALRPDVAHQFKRVFNDIGLAGFDRAIELENEAQRLLMSRRPAQ